jgi:carbon monoxide dehydrogenase subunit G
MRITGLFTTTAGIGALRSMHADPKKLSAVPAFADVEPTAGGGFTVVLTPATSFGRQPIEARIVTERADDTGCTLRVHGRRGPHVIDVHLVIGLGDEPARTLVRWEAEVEVRGPGASVAQRVAPDVVGHAIGDLLMSTAAACA